MCRDRRARGARLTQETPAAHCRGTPDTYQSARGLERTVPLCRANLALREQILGATHTDTLAGRHDLFDTH
jgi:hypothetical protein